LLSAKYERAPRALRGAAKAVAEALGSPKGGALFRKVRRARKFFNANDLPFPDRFVRYRSYFEAAEVSALLGTELPAEQLLEEHLIYWTRVNDRPLLDRICYLDIKTYLPCLNLAYADRASMAASLELREPLLDLALTQFAVELPERWRIRGRRTKAVLKALAARYVPRSVVSRGKVGFGSPVRAWLTGPLRPMVAEFLSPEAIRRTGIVDTDAVQKIVANHRHEDWPMRVWALLNLQVWARTVPSLRGYTAPASSMA
jgi:asparagine synthase (glutamine-hydrolysing)